MNEIKETLAILKTRWLEATLIIGLRSLPNLLNHIRIYRWGILASLMTVGIFLIFTIVSTGFLRTVYLEHDKRQSLLDLMRIGKHFLWRIFGFSLLCGLATMPFVWLFGRLFGNRIGFTLMQLLLAKLTLLIPAIIIVLDCSLSKSFGLMWKVKLLKAKPLLIIFLIWIVVLPYLLLPFSPYFRGAQPAITWGYTLFTLHYIMLHILALMVQVMAVRFVSSLGIQYFFLG